MITISLCMIVKNEERILKRCLDSVRDLVDEIIIVDNGSEDETPQIAEMLCQKYEKVRYERINVRGVGAAFRRGVELPLHHRERGHPDHPRDPR